MTFATSKPGHAQRRRRIGLLAGALLSGLIGSAAAVHAQDYRSIQSPTGNIHCIMETGEWAGVRCDLKSLTPSFKRPPADCDLDWGSSFFVGPQGKGVLACVGDTVINPNAPVLGYGKSVQFGAFTCTSEKTGMTCTNGLGHGFSVSKAKQKLF